MTDTKSFHLILFAMIAVGLLSGCYPRFDYAEEFGPQVRTSLLIFFRKDVPIDLTEQFWYEMFMNPDSRGGFQMREGICRIGRAKTIQDHLAIAVDFCRNITPAQREEIMSRVQASPIVFKILEDVIPAEVKEVE